MLRNFLIEDERKGEGRAENLKSEIFVANQSLNIKYFMKHYLNIIL